MSREVENVISRAMDELNLDGPASQSAGPGAVASRGDNDELSLPTVPQDAAGDRKRDDASSKPCKVLHAANLQIKYTSTHMTRKYLRLRVRFKAHKK